jgi:hypothetical protein
MKYYLMNIKYFNFRSGLDNLILLNISPLLKSEQLSAQLAEVHKRINAQSSKLMDGDQQEGTSEYVLRNLPSSFSLLVIDHLARSESLVQVPLYLQCFLKLL